MNWWNNLESWEKKWLVGIIVFLSLVGIGAGVIFWNKANKVVTAKYKGVYLTDTRTIYLVRAEKAEDIPQIKKMLTKQFCSMTNFVNAVIWITTEPDSFPTNDPIDQRIHYFTAENSATAFDLTRRIITDSNWTQTMKNRELFVSFVLEDNENKMLDSLRKDKLVDGYLRLALEASVPKDTTKKQ